MNDIILQESDLQGLFVYKCHEAHLQRCEASLCSGSPYCQCHTQVLISDLLSAPFSVASCFGVSMRCTLAPSVTDNAAWFQTEGSCFPSLTAVQTTVVLADLVSAIFHNASFHDISQASSLWEYMYCGCWTPNPTYKEIIYMQVLWLSPNHAPNKAVPWGIFPESRSTGKKNSEMLLSFCHPIKSSILLCSVMLKNSSWYLMHYHTWYDHLL